MSLRIIHTADWQIAKPFANLPSELAGELAAARLAIIPRIGKIAREAGAAHVLVAGDVFDSDRLDAVTLRRALARLDEERAVTWLLLPGNHDPARAGGIWERAARIGLPSNVVALTEPNPYEITPGAVVLPAVLANNNPGADPSEWMDSCQTPPGTLRIGLAHGSVHGFSSEGESAVSIARNRAARAGLDYLALGDWHGLKEIDARTWYSGTPEPDRFPDNAPGHVLAVSIDGAGAPPVVTPHASAAFTWLKLEASLTGVRELEAIERRISAAAPSLGHMLVRLKLSGRLTLHEDAQLRQWREEIEGRVRHFETDTRQLAIAAESADLDVFGAGGALRQSAEELAAQSQSQNEAERRIAALALQKLYTFASLMRENAS